MDTDHGDTETRSSKLLEERLTEQIIGAAIEVHKVLGPGLLEGIYHDCLARELTLRGIPFRSEVDLPLAYKGQPLDGNYRIDLLILTR